MTKLSAAPSKEAEKKEVDLLDYTKLPAWRNMVSNLLRKAERDGDIPPGTSEILFITAFHPAGEKLDEVWKTFAERVKKNPIRSLLTEGDLENAIDSILTELKMVFLKRAKEYDDIHTKVYTNRTDKTVRTAETEAADTLLRGYSDLIRSIKTAEANKPKKGEEEKELPRDIQTFINTCPYNVIERRLKRTPKKLIKIIPVSAFDAIKSAVFGTFSRVLP